MALLVDVVPGYGKGALVLEFPDEGGEFARDGDDDLLFAHLAGLQAAIACVETGPPSPHAAGPPGVGDGDCVVDCFLI